MINTETYTFSAGPASEPYTVSTPWTREGVALAIRDFPAFMRDPGCLHGTMIMLLDSPALDGLAVDAMDGTGRRIRLGEVRRALDAWTAFDRAEQAWEDRW